MGDESLSTLFDYVPEAGVLLHRNRDRQSFNTRHAGRVAGKPDKQGYWRVRVNGQMQMAHRVIWEMTNGPIPPSMVVDHIDGNPSNNRLANLRLASVAQNACNSRVRSDNKTGVKGVRWVPERKRFVVQITPPGGRKRHIGCFIDFDAAVAARRAAEQILHQGFSRLGGKNDH